MLTNGWLGTGSEGETRAAVTPGLEPDASRESCLDQATRLAATNAPARTVVGARGRTQTRSISTATERCKRLSDTTNRCEFLIWTSMPSRPASGPRSTRTPSPVLRNGHGSTARPDSTKRSIASISSRSIGSGTRPMPTTWSTPGMVRTGNRRFTSKAPKTYPGNRGSSICLAGPDRRDSFWYRGRNSSYPLPFRLVATAFSQFERTRNANHSLFSTLSTS